MGSVWHLRLRGPDRRPAQRDHAVDQIRRVLGQPEDPRVLAEPRVLPPGETASAVIVSSRASSSVTCAVEELEHLPVPERPGCGESLAQTGSGQRHAPRPPVRPPHPVHPSRRSVRPGSADRCRARSGPPPAARSGGPAASALNGPSVSSTTSRARTIRRPFSGAGSARPRPGRASRQPLVQSSAGPIATRCCLEPGPEVWVGGRELEVVDDRPDVERRATDHDRDDTARRQSSMAARARRWNSATVAVSRTSMMSIR